MVNFFRRPVFETPAWGILIPLFSLGILFAFIGEDLSLPSGILVCVALLSAVLVAVHHAEVIALRVGEPFGTLILALAVTIIEVSLIVTLMLSGGTAISALARDTVFATVMIVCNGVVGACLVVGTARHHVLSFRAEGAGHTLAALIPLLVLTLVLPNFTTTTPGPTYALPQLLFAGSAALILYGVFVFAQTVRHRDYFLPLEGSPSTAHAPPPSNAVTWASSALLVLSLLAVVGLAKRLAPSIEAGILAISAPLATVGLVIALIVLAPESVAALRAAWRNRMQTSLNLALGSALASIGLTIPAVAALSISYGLPLELGLAPAQIVLLSLTMLLSAITLAGGRATVLHGAVHLVVFGAYLLMAFVP